MRRRHSDLVDEEGLEDVVRAHGVCLEVVDGVKLRRGDIVRGGEARGAEGVKVR